MDADKVNSLQATALSIGRVLADATLELWETKIRKGKRTEKGIDKYRRKLAAAALLRRAKDKKRRSEKNKAEQQKKSTKRKSVDQGRTSEEIKLAFRLATWHGRLRPNLSLNEYIELYVNTPNTEEGNRGGRNTNVLSSNLVRGRIN
jgi:hypothetical protein